MKIIIYLMLLICVQLNLSIAQYPHHPHPQYPEQWNAQWITHPEIDESAYGLIHFRNVFQLKSIPDTFLVHVSGDNRYRLYVNGQAVCYGPQLGDIRHWRYETIDLAPYLQKGDNVIAAEVMNWGIERSYGIISFKTAFLLQGHTEKEQIINTNVDSDWKVLKNRGIYADDPEQTFYDQRASILAVLCGAHSTEEAQTLMRKTLDPETQFDSKANLFYYFYLFEAMAKAGVGNFTEQLQPWQAIMEMGMSGTPEKRIEQHPRSEIHPWTAHPVHYYFRVVAGIRPTAPGFAEVEIKPNPGQLREIQARHPTAKGDITVNIAIKSKNKVSGKIILPADITGVYKWQGQKVNLKPGVNIIK